MVIRRATRQVIAIWLSAILAVLSFAAASHTHSQDEGAKVECTLCFHQHQFNKVLPSVELDLNLKTQTYLESSEESTQTYPAHVRYYQSRAPPSFS